MADTQEPTISAPATAAVPVADSANIAATTSTAPAASTEAAASSITENPTVTSTGTESAPSAVSEPIKTEAKVESKAETPTPPATESILGDEKPKLDEKKDAKVDGKDAKAEVATETKVELPIYETFKLPENVTLDKEPLDAFTKILGEIETGKLDHAGMQSAGQKLIDLAAKSTTDSINRLNDYYVGIHENQKKEWFEASKKDPELGNGDDKVFREIAGKLSGSIGEFGGSAEQQKEFRALMRDTGVGNHPALLRMLNNMQKKIDSYTKETSDRSVPAQAPAPSKVKPYQKFYTGNNG